MSGVRMKDLKRAAEYLTWKITPRSTSDSLSSRGLSSEGYNGGYRDAIWDVMSATGGFTPQRWERWFAEMDEAKPEGGS